MSTKQKAELQRRLSMAQVPAPPADLADRIKRDITLPAAAPRRNGMLVALRIAAAVVLVVGAASLVLLLSHGRTEREGAPVALRKPRESRMSEIAPVPATPADSSRNSAVPAPPPHSLDANPFPTASPTRSAVAENHAPAEFTPPPPPARTQADTRDVAEPSTMAENDAPTAAMERMTAKTTAGASPGGAALDQRASVAPAAASVTPAAPSVGRIATPQSLFGIAPDDEALHRVKEAIERNERPREADVRAVTSYFAAIGGTDSATLELDAEVSALPFHPSANQAIVRVSIDTPRQTGAVASAAELTIDFDRRAVAHVREGGDHITVRERSLPGATSVTLLYPVELREPVSPHRTIAIATLRYVDAGGSERTLRRIIDGSAVSRPWTSATRRQRLATLSQAWGEAQRGAAAYVDVTEAAEELAREDPSDARARELAALASASGRLRSSGRTGSER